MKFNERAQQEKKRKDYNYRREFHLNFHDTYKMCSLKSIQKYTVINTMNLLWEGK